MNSTIRDQVLNTLATRTLTCLIAWSAEHTSRPVAISYLAQNCNAAEGIIKQALARLENEDKIHIISWAPFRYFLRAGKDLPAPRPQVDPGRYERFLEVEGKRQRMGRFVGEFERDHGRGPNLKELGQVVGSENLNWVNAQMDILVERGQVIRGPNGPVLSEDGRSFYRVKPKPPTGGGGDKEPEAPKVVVVHQEAPAPKATRVLAAPNESTLKEGHRESYQKLLLRIPEAGRFIADFIRQNRGALPTRDALAEYLDIEPTRAGRIARRMAALNLLEGGHKKRLHSYALTELGLKEFAPDLAPIEKAPVEPVEARPPEPQVETPTPAPVIAYALPMEAPAANLSTTPTADLIMELIERGYTVRRN